MKKSKIVLYIVLSVFFSVNCGAYISKKLPAVESSMWKMSVNYIKIGDKYGPGRFGTHRPKNKEDQLVYVNVTVENQLAQGNIFDFSGCQLVAGKIQRPAGIVDKTKFLNFIFRDKTSSVKPGKRVVRNLVFAFPKNLRPTTFVCNDMREVAIPENITNK